MTSFVQYSYCKLCKESHRNIKDHVFSLRHKNIVSNIINKLKEKIKIANADLCDPVIEDISWEKGCTFWCYFCEDEVPKHIQLDLVTVRYGGIIGHFASLNHKKKAQEFMGKNRMKMKQLNKLLLTDQQFEDFVAQAEKSIKRYKLEEKAKVSQMAEKIRWQETVRSRLTTQYHRMYGPLWIQHYVFNISMPGFTSEGKLDGYTRFTSDEPTDTVSSMKSHCGKKPYDSQAGKKIVSPDTPMFTQAIYNPNPVVKKMTATESIVGPSAEEFEHYVTEKKRYKMYGYDRLDINSDNQNCLPSTEYYRSLKKDEKRLNEMKKKYIKRVSVGAQDKSQCERPYKTAKLTEKEESYFSHSFCHGYSGTPETSLKTFQDKCGNQGMKHSTGHNGHNGIFTELTDRLDKNSHVTYSNTQRKRSQYTSDETYHIAPDIFEDVKRARTVEIDGCDFKHKQKLCKNMNDPTNRYVQTNNLSKTIDANFHGTVDVTPSATITRLDIANHLL